MVKLLLIVAMLTLNAHSQECSVRASYVVEIWIKEMATLPIAAKVPSPQMIATYPQKGKPNGIIIIPFPPAEPSLVGHIDQHDYG